MTTNTVERNHHKRREGREKMLVKEGRISSHTCAWLAWVLVLLFVILFVILFSCLLLLSRECLCFYIFSSCLLRQPASTTPFLENNLYMSFSRIPRMYVYVLSCVLLFLVMQVVVSDASESLSFLILSSSLFNTVKVRIHVFYVRLAFDSCKKRYPRWVRRRRRREGEEDSSRERETHSQRPPQEAWLIAWLNFLEVFSRMYLMLVMAVVLSLDFASSPQMNEGKVGVERSQIVWSTCKSWKTKWSFCFIRWMKSLSVNLLRCPRERLHGIVIISYEKTRKT